MATDSQHDGPAQCDVPDITFTSENTTTNTQSPGRSTPNMPILLLAKPREGTQQQLNQEVAPTIQTTRTGDSVPAVALLQRPLSAPTSFTSSGTQHTAVTLSDSAPAVDVDSPIVQALKSSKDRLYVLKLGETMENLISQGKLYAKVDLQPASSYQRLLVHRCAEFYHLTQENSPTTVSVIVTADSRIPSKRISELVPPEETVLPAFQIMRRVDRPKTVSRATSVDGNLTDEGDETRSQGSGSKKKAHRTIEEREAEYNKARSRIFMDFEEKDASASSGGAMSSAASIVSYTGGSAGMSSVDGDGASTAPTESEYSSPAGRVKEGWSTPGSYAGSTGRGKPSNATSHSTGTLRSSAPPFTSPNVSPPPPQGTVNYIPDPSISPTPDLQQPHMRHIPTGPPAGYPAFAAPAMYPFYVPYFLPMPYPPPPPPSIAPQQPQESQVPEHHQSQQPSQPPIQSGYPMPPQPYPGYMWVPAPPPGYIPVQAAMPPPPPVSMHGPPSRPASQTSHQSNSSYDQRVHQSQPQPYQQPINQGTLQSTPPYILPGQQQHSAPSNFTPSNQNRNTKNPNPVPNTHPPARNLGPTGRPTATLNGGPPPLANHHPGGPPPTNPTPNVSWNQQSLGGPGEILTLSGPPRSPGQTMDSNRASGSAIGPGGNTSLPGRGIARNPWGNYSYGPGVGIGGMQTVNIGGPNTNIPRAPDGLSIRILPPITLDNHSAGSSNGSSSSLRKRNVMGGNVKTPGDETSSVTSSSSSSSKRTFTSNASSQPPQHHPLPERPDWVLNTRSGVVQSRNKTPATGVGNVSRPSLPSTTPPAGTISSASSVSGSDSKEFPPLGTGNDGRSTSSGGQGHVSRPKATTTSPTSVWNSALTSSPARTPGAIGGSASLPPRPTAGPGPATSKSDAATRLDDADVAFERPPPKSGSALYNPHTTRSKSGDQTAGGKASNAVDSLSQSLNAVALADGLGTQSRMNEEGGLVED